MEETEKIKTPVYRFEVRQRLAHSAVAIIVFLTAGFILHIVHGGFASLFGFKAFIFSLVGVFIAPLVLGRGGYELQRGLIHVLNIQPETALEKEQTYAAVGLSMLLIILEMVVGIWLAKEFYGWLYTYS
jgi:hypothetical protein